MHKGYQLDLYFNDLNDFFADFLNHVRYCVDRDPYFDETIHPMHHNQGGLFYIFCWSVKKIADVKQGASLNDLWNNHTLILLTFWYLLIQIFFMYHSLLCFCKKCNTSKIILIPLMMSNPMLFSIERANPVIFTAACTIYFITFYDDSDKKKRLIACICLAIAASQKIYPVIFGFLYFEKKQYKEIVISAFFAFVLFFLPFFFFKHGLYNFPRLIDNVRQFSKLENRSFPFLIIKFLCLLSIALSLFQKKLFNRFLCLIFPFLILSTNAGFYTTLYFYPLIVLLFNQQNTERYSINTFDILFFFGYFAYLLMPLQISCYIFGTFKNKNSIIYYSSLRYIFVVIFFYKFVYTIEKQRLDKK